MACVFYSEYLFLCLLHWHNWATVQVHIALQEGHISMCLRPMKSPAFFAFPKSTGLKHVPKVLFLKRGLKELSYLPTFLFKRWMWKISQIIHLLFQFTLQRVRLSTEGAEKGKEK